MLKVTVSIQIAIVTGPQLVRAVVTLAAAPKHERGGWFDALERTAIEGCKSFYVAQQLRNILFPNKY